MLTKNLESLVFSSVVVSLAASILTYCTFIFLKLKPSYETIFFVFLGTLTVYNIDHIRGLASDRELNPRRHDFITRNINAIQALVILSVLSCLFLSINIKVRNLILIIPAIILGLFHRRFKNKKLFASIYITLSWVVVVILFPANINGEMAKTAWILSIIGSALFANAYASAFKNDFEGNYFIIPISIAILGTVIGLIAPKSFHPLILIPALVAIALFNFRKNEMFDAIYLDGSLIIGATLSIFIFRFL